MRATDKVIKKNQNTVKKIENRIYNYKMAAKKQLLSRDIKCLTKNGKTTFPKEFVLEIWLMIEDCKHNYTAEIKFGTKLFGCTFMGKTNFEQRPKNGNLC